MSKFMTSLLLIVLVSVVGILATFSWHAHVVGADAPTRESPQLAPTPPAASNAPLANLCRASFIPLGDGTQFDAIYDGVTIASGVTFQQIQTQCGRTQ